MEEDFGREFTMPLKIESNQEFQYGIQLLWEISDLRQYLNDRQRNLLRELRSKLDKFHSYTLGQQKLLLNILEETKVKKAEATAKAEEAARICHYCGNLGFLTAIKKSDNYKYVFRCNCKSADLRGFNWPIWDNEYVHAFEASHWGSIEPSKEEVEFYKSVVFDFMGRVNANP